MIGVGRSVAHVEAPGIRAHPLYRPLNLKIKSRARATAAVSPVSETMCIRTPCSSN
jgi:hypothetical protein